MATRVFSDEELEGLRSFPAIGKDELIRYFTLTPADEAFLRKFLRPQTVLGAAVQLCTLPWLGFVPDEVPSAPLAAVGRLARQLGLPVEVLRGYGVSREQTRTDHLRQVAMYLGWRAAKSLELKELDEFLLARAMEHDLPSLLFRLGCEYLRSAKVIRPGVVSLLEKVATARRAAERETHARVAHLLDAGRAQGLDGLLVVEPKLKSSRLHWLVTGPVQASPNSVGGEVEKLKFLRGLGADTLDLSVLPAERRRHLAQIGRRLTAQALVRREPNRRHPILLTLLAQSAVDVLDSVVQLFDQTLSGSESRARIKLRDALAERARLSEDRLALLDEILPVLADTGILDEDVGTLLREKIGMDRIRTAHAGATVRLPKDHGHLRLLEGSYTYIRQFAPKVLEALRFAGGTDAKPLIEALQILRELNATGTRNVPSGAPTLFVPARWQGYLDEAAAKGDATAYRHYWELCTLLALRDGLRSGDVYVPGSRRYDNPAAYLFTPAQWETHRTQFCRLVGKSPDFSEALPLAMDELDDALADLESTLKKGDGPVRLGDDGELVISPLTAEDIPSEAEELHAELERMLPNVPIASLLVETDRHAGFLDCFTHAGGKQTRSPQLKRNLIACLIGLSTNLGLHGMASSCGIPYDVLAWTAEWYIREDTLREANICLVNYHHQLPMTTMFGSGTLSSSDGQRFPTRGKSITARHLNKYFVAEGISTYTHVSDQHSTFGTKVIVATHREAHYVLDEILGNATDLPITEHATDTHGVTLVNFALFDLVGKQFSPRIRDLLATRYALASFLGEAEDAAAAEEAFAELMEDRVQVLGPDHPDTLATRLKLATWRGKTGDAAGAAAALEELLQDRVRALGPDHHPDTVAAWRELAVWRGKAGDWAGAADATEHLLEHMVRNLGPDHPDILTARDCLTAWYREAGDAVGAADATQELLDARVRVLGPDHPDTVAAWHSLAVWRGKAGDAAGAAAATEHLLRHMVRDLGSDHPHVLTARDSLAAWYGEAGDAAVAAKAYEQLLAARRRVLGENHPETLAAWGSIAHWRGQAGDAVGAVTLTEQLLEHMVRVLGEEHPHVPIIRHNLAHWRKEEERGTRGVG